MNNKLKYPYIKIFLMCFIVMMVTFLPELIYNNGIFLYYGDFTAQQIPFEMHLHNAIKTGQINWDWITGLGTDLQTSYNFYTLYSPFFLITLLFPVNWIPYLIAPLYALKVSCMGIASYLCFKYFLKNEEASYLAAFLYAFSGWQLCNLFFNHFAEPMILFPLLLYSFEKTYRENKKYLFCIIVLFSIIINYFFFFGQVLFIILYFIIRISFDKEYRSFFKNIIFVIFEGIIAIILSAFTILPTIDYLQKFSRTTAMINTLPKALLYKDVWHYLEIIKGMFCIPNITGTEGMFPFDYKWASISTYLPIISLVFVICFLFNKNNNKKWLKAFICALFIIAFIPILNASFSLFNIQYYARWFYMFTFFLILASLYFLIEYNSNKEQYIKLIFKSNTFVMLVSFILFIISICYQFSSLNKEIKEVNMFQIFFQIGISLISYLIIHYIFIKQYNKKNIINSLIILMLFTINIVCSMGNVFYGSSAMGEVLDYKYSENNILLNDNTFYRIGTDNDDFNNLGLYLDKPSTQTFISSIDQNSSNFFDLFNKRTVNSFIDVDNNGVLSILSTKYQINTKLYKTETFNLYKDIETDKEQIINIRLNENFVPFGFYYENYIPINDFKKLNKKEKNIVSTIALPISEEKENIFSEYMTKYDIKILSEFKEQEQIKENCNILKQHTVNDLIVDTNNILCTITTKKPQIIFFSMPYNEHWVVEVNNEKVETYNVFNGLTGVKVNKGISNISFTYRNLKREKGIELSFFGMFLFLGYFCILHCSNKKCNH